VSTSIYGFIEVKLFDTGFDNWYSAIDISAIFTGNYDIFGCLFGVRNPSNFAPLFADRGLPKDCCDNIKEDFESGEYRNPTWCSYKELVCIDREEKALAPDSRVYKMHGGVRIKGYPDSDEERALAKVMSRGDVLKGAEYDTLVELMSVLVKRYGEEGVRWVAYFD
jgi:hypothetical protein